MNDLHIPLPRILDGKTLAYKQTISPVKVSVELNLIPLSTVTMEMPHGETILAGDYAEVYTSSGFVGIFRARNPADSYEVFTSEVELESAIVELGDYLMKTKYEQMMDIKDAITAVFDEYPGTFWQLGSLTALGSKDIAFSCGYDNLLEVLLSIMEQDTKHMMDFDYTTTPWTVNFIARDTVVTAEGRLSRNVESATISHDNSEMCTRAYYEWGDELHHVDTTQEIQQRYGIFERLVSVDSGYTQEQALVVVLEYLNKHHIPRVTIDIELDDLSQITGEPLDTVRLGKLFRLVIPSYEVLTEKTVFKLCWDDVYGQPRRVTVTLEDEEEAVIRFIQSEQTSASVDSEVKRIQEEINLKSVEIQKSVGKGVMK